MILCLYVRIILTWPVIWFSHLLITFLSSFWYFIIEINELCESVSNFPIRIYCVESCYISFILMPYDTLRIMIYCVESYVWSLSPAIYQWNTSLAVLHLLCFTCCALNPMCPFYYSNYQSILFCVQSVIKFLSHNDVCVCLSIVLYLPIPHSYNPHLTSYLILLIC